jgi:hypothetical protein
LALVVSVQAEVTNGLVAVLVTVKTPAFEIVPSPDIGVEVHWLEAFTSNKFPGVTVVTPKAPPLIAVTVIFPFRATVTSPVICWDTQDEPEPTRRLPPVAVVLPNGVLLIFVTVVAIFPVPDPVTSPIKLVDTAAACNWIKTIGVMPTVNGPIFVSTHIVPAFVVPSETTV